MTSFPYHEYPLEPLTLPPSQKQFLTDHHSLFVKVQREDPQREYLASTQAKLAGIPTVAALAPGELRDDGYWLLPFPHHSFRPLGFSQEDQEVVGELMVELWATPPPAGLASWSQQFILDRSLAMIDPWRGLLPERAAYLQERCEKSSRSLEAWLSPEDEQYWAHGDVHPGNLAYLGGEGVFLDWGLTHVGSREVDAGKYLEAALVEHPGGVGPLPTAILNKWAEAGLNMDAVWAAAVRAAGIHEAFIHRGGGGADEATMDALELLLDPSRITYSWPVF